LEEEALIIARTVKNKCINMVIGITGGIASGKTFVTDYLSKKGYFILDTDKLYKKLIEPNGICYNAIIKEFPYLNSDNTIDLKKLSSVVFNDSKKIELLNSLVHPLIYKECAKIIESRKNEITFLVVPLMFEAGFDKLCDKIVCVYVSHEEQIKRVMARDNISYEMALKKIANQMDVEEKKKKSDILLESCEDFNDTIKNIERTLERINDYGKNI